MTTNNYFRRVSGLSGLVSVVSVSGLMLSGCHDWGGGGGGGSPDPTPTNTLPVAEAGANQSVTEGATVQLNGAGSDVEGPITIAWTQVSGPSIAFSNTATASPTFVAPQVNAATTVVLRMTVTDNSNATASDTVTINVNDSATPPSSAYNRRVRTMRYDFDHNGVFEATETFTYNTDGSVQSSAYVYTPDGVPDVDLISFSLSPGGNAGQDGNQNDTYLYNAQGQLERWTLQSLNDRTELNFNWRANGTLDTANFDNLNSVGALVSRLSFVTTYTSGRLTAWQATTPQSPLLNLSLALTYDAAGVLQHDVKTTVPGNSQVRRDFTWNAAGAIDFMHEFSLTNSFDATTDFIYAGGRIVEQIRVSPQHRYSWNYEYDANGLPRYHRVDLDDNGSYEADIEISWETGTCRDVIAWAPQAEPSPFKRLSDPRTHSFGDGHFVLQLCGTVP